MAKNLSPLRRHPALEQAAKALARGAKLPNSLEAAGYRSQRSAAVFLSGEGIGDDAAALLAKKGYCPQMTDGGLSEVGIYEGEQLVWIVMAAPYAPSVRMSEASAGRRVLTLTNQARAKRRSCGGTMFNAARPVRWNETLAEAARLHAEDMADHDYFSHDGRDGSHPAQRVERAGYNYRSTGENIAAGLQSPEEAVAGWINSPSHCANLMNPVFTEMGSGFAVSPTSAMGVYWAQEFGRPR